MSPAAMGDEGLRAVVADIFDSWSLIDRLGFYAQRHPASECRGCNSLHPQGG